MAESTILTGQFVRISQTPASIGERIIALIIDYVLIGFYIFSTVTVLSKLRLPSDFTMVFFLAVIYLPVLFYSFLCEMFNYGQSLGKRLMNIRVVKADGSVPSISSYLLRWLLFPIDGPITGGLGLLVALLTKNSQRMGDLAAGTMVIKEKNYRKIHVSLDEFDYLTQNYQPTYPQAADLSLEQINVITRTLQSGKKDRIRYIAQLTKKVQELLSVTPRENNQEKFLQTVLRDYQYYALEEMADKLFVSEEYLSSQFKKEIGVGFKEMVRTLQIERIKELLTNTKLKLNQIAELAGYSDAKYMSRVFKDEVGVLPSEFRKSAHC